VRDDSLTEALKNAIYLWPPVGPGNLGLGRPTLYAPHSDEPKYHAKRRFE